jgi:hypothetical protein
MAIPGKSTVFRDALEMDPLMTSQHRPENSYPLACRAVRTCRPTSTFHTGLAVLAEAAKARRAHSPTVRPKPKPSDFSLSPRWLSWRYECYTKAVRARPNDPQSYVNRAAVYDELGEYSKVIADYSKVIRLRPRDIDAYQSRSEAYAKKGAKAKADADLRTIERPKGQQD